jgi:serine/threonine protein phosphatase PrpC
MTSLGRAVLAGVSADPLRAAGATDAGLQREVNEDRFHCDADRGVFAVIDGVGGQAAGGKAADVAVALLRERLAQDAGTIADRIRDGITAANNEIHRLAASRAEWNGMACVLTIAIVRNGKVTFGHVGDTRLYKLRADRIEKLTRDHSPVGEREDASEITERQAMRHPRRNEVYRDVGSELHDRRDRDFIDVDDIPFEPDAALLLCSDGLTDLVDSVTIARTVSQWAGDPDSVVRELIAAANAAGGKDNVTVVYVEGEQFAASQYGRTAIQSHSAAGPFNVEDSGSRTATRRRLLRLATAVLLAGVAATVTLRAFGWTFTDMRELAGRLPFQSGPIQRTVAATESIAEALVDAAPGSVITVEPGVYREQLTLRPGVALISRVPRGATIRLPAIATDVADVAAVIARNAAGASFVGFNVSGDSASPLPVGILVQDSSVSIVDVAITGATRAAIEFVGAGTSSLMASDIRDNSGSALVVRDGHTPYVSHNLFARNGRSDRAVAPVVIDKAAPVFTTNWFVGMGTGSFVTLGSAAQADLVRDNSFVSR